MSLRDEECQRQGRLSSVRADVLRERAEFPQRTLVSFFRLEVFQGISDRTVRLCVSRHYDPEFVMTYMHEEIATARNNEGVPTEDKARQHESCKLDDRAITKPIPRCGLKRAIFAKAAAHHLQHGPSRFFNLRTTYVRECYP